MAGFFTRAALLTFGGAYAVLPYVYQGAVETWGWLTAAQMIDGLALGETTPGPLIMVVAFVGFVGGWTRALFGPDALALAGIAGAVCATFFTFLPSFLFILAGGPLVESTHGQLRFTAPLTAITAAVVGVIVNLALFFAVHVLWPQGRGGGFDPAGAAIAAGAALALFRFRAGVIPVIAAVRRGRARAAVACRRSAPPRHSIVHGCSQRRQRTSRLTPAGASGASRTAPSANRAYAPHPGQTARSERYSARKSWLVNRFQANRHSAPPPTATAASAKKPRGPDRNSTVSSAIAIMIIARNPVTSHRCPSISWRSCQRRKPRLRMASAIDTWFSGGCGAGGGRGSARRGSDRVYARVAPVGNDARVRQWPVGRGPVGRWAGGREPAGWSCAPMPDRGRSPDG